jgi:hypothetical protein
MFDSGDSQNWLAIPSNQSDPCVTADSPRKETVFQNARQAQEKVASAAGAELWRDQEMVAANVEKRNGLCNGIVMTPISALSNETEHRRRTHRCRYRVSRREPESALGQLAKKGPANESLLCAPYRSRLWFGSNIRRGNLMRFLPGALVFAAGLSAQTLNPPPDSVRTVVGRLELERYKEQIKGLTQFGDRMQGTQRNRDAIDWIEKQLRSFGYSNVERHRFMSGSGPLENIYATKIGTTIPGEMYIVSAHKMAVF